MISKYLLDNNRIQEFQESETGIPVLIFRHPTESDIQNLVDTYGLDAHTVQSALDPDEVPRIEFEDDHWVIIFKSPRNYSGDKSFEFKIQSVGLFVFHNKLLIVTGDNWEFPEGRRFNKISGLTDLIMKILNTNIIHFTQHLKAINQITDEIEGKINQAMENKNLILLFSLQKSMVYYLNAINANSHVIERLRLNAPKLQFSSEDQEFLEDLSIENRQCYRQAEIYTSVLADLMDARASIVGNNLNILMKTLNIITIGIMVPTFVVSAFSMNVKIPMEDNPHAFLIVMSLSVASVLGFLTFWKLKKW